MKFTDAVFLEKWLGFRFEGSGHFRGLGFVFNCLVGLFSKKRDLRKALWPDFPGGGVVDCSNYS